MTIKVIGMLQRKAHSEEVDVFDTIHGGTPTAQCLKRFKSITLPVPGEFMTHAWNTFNDIEKRFVSQLSESYPDWSGYIIKTVGRNKYTLASATPLQRLVCHKRLNFDGFIDVLLDQFSTQPKFGLKVKIISDKKSPNYGKAIAYGEADTGLGIGIDLLMKGNKPLYAGAFEVACYFFAFAFNYFDAQGREIEYKHALLEASIQLGTFRGWCAITQELEQIERERKNKQHAAKVKAEQEFGPHKTETIRILKEEVLQQGWIFKTKSDLIKLLTDRLNQYIEENNLKKSDDIFNLIKGWCYRNDDIKKSFNELTFHKK